MMKKYIFNTTGLLLSFLSLFLLYFGAEFCIGLFFPEINIQGTEQKLKKANAFGKSDGWVPGGKGKVFGMEVEIDGNGFRKMRHPANADRTWLLVGDSVAFGVGIRTEDTFAYKLQDYYSNICILNSSVVGANILDHYETIKYFTAKKTDIEKIIMFYSLNDIYTRETAIMSRGNIFKRFSSWLSVKSRLYVFLKSFLSDRSRANFLYDFSFYKKDNPDFIKTCETLKNINKLCLEKKIDFTIFLLPYEMQLREKDEKLFYPQLLLRETLGDKLKIIDVSYAFLKDNKKSDSYFLYADPMHLSVVGSNIVFDAIIFYLQ
jgi:hypothetical protein